MWASGNEVPMTLICEEEKNISPLGQFLGLLYDRRVIYPYYVYISLIPDLTPSRTICRLSTSPHL